MSAGLDLLAALSPIAVGGTAGWALGAHYCKPQHRIHRQRKVALARSALVAPSLGVERASGAVRSASPAQAPPEPGPATTTTA